jgi:hypothetical protein
MPRAIPQHRMTIDEYQAWRPSYESHGWELIDGVPVWRGHRLRVQDIAATTPEELIDLLEHGCNLWRDREPP